MWYNSPAPYRSVNEIVQFLIKNPFRTESEIQERVFGYYRNSSIFSNKKYADMLRRGLDKGLIKRIIWKKKSESRKLYYYYVPTNMQTLYKVEEYTDPNSGNVCELFQVIVDGVLVYERDYGSVGSGIQEYVENYLDFIS